MKLNFLNFLKKNKKVKIKTEEILTDEYLTSIEKTPINNNVILLPAYYIYKNGFLRNFSFDDFVSKHDEYFNKKFENSITPHNFLFLYYIIEETIEFHKDENRYYLYLSDVDIGIQDALYLEFIKNNDNYIIKIQDEIHNDLILITKNNKEYQIDKQKFIFEGETLHIYIDDNKIYMKNDSLLFDFNGKISIKN